MKEPSVILIMTNNGAVDMALNLIYTLKLHGLRGLEICALDRDAFSSLKQYNLPARLVDVNCDWQYQPYGTEGFKRVVTHKLKLISEYLAIHESVLYIDVDIVVAGNILEHLQGDYDIWIQTDWPDLPKSNLCTGFMQLRSSDIVKRFLQATINIHETNVLKEDQAAFNMVYRARDILGLKSLKLQILPSNLFQNGTTYFQQNGALKQPCLIHNNWLPALEDKIRRFKEFELWYIEREDFVQVLGQPN